MAYTSLLRPPRPAARYVAPHAIGPGPRLGPKRVSLRRLVTLAGFTVTLVLISACSQLSEMPPPPTPTPPTKPQAAAAAVPTVRPKDRPTPTPLPRITDSGPVVTPRTEVYVDLVQMPVGLTFAPDGRLFFSEAFSGVVRIAERVDEKARLLDQPFVQLETAKGPETGMLGIALHPDFEQNRWVYLYYSEPDPKRKDRVPGRNRIVRFTERDNLATEMTVILDNIGIHRQGRHNGGIMRFGPDGKLYVTIGNAQDRKNSQNPAKLNGKVLRLNPDGSVPADNPIPGSPVYALGFRNPFGLTFEPGTNNVWVTENSGDNNDEVDFVKPGGNYGFPHYEGFGHDPKYEDPVWSSGTRTIGPTGIAFYTGDQLPQYRGDVFFCAVNTGALTRLRLGGVDRRTVLSGEEIASNCHLDVLDGPDGALYYSSVSQILKMGR